MIKRKPANLSFLIFVYLEHLVREIGLNLGWVHTGGQRPDLELLQGILRPAQIIVRRLEVITEDLL